jgi:hypothetical protein
VSTAASFDRRIEQRRGEAKDAMVNQNWPLDAPSGHSAILRRPSGEGSKGRSFASAQAAGAGAR